MKKKTGQTLGEYVFVIGIVFLIAVVGYFQFADSWSTLVQRTQKAFDSSKNAS